MSARTIAPFGAAVAGAVVLLLALATMRGDARLAGLLAVAGAYALMTLGYHLTFGLAGALSLAQGAFFGLGAYAFALPMLALGMPAGWALLAAILAPTIAAALVGLVVLRLGTHYFALATLALAQIALILAVEWQALTGGANGLPFAAALGALAPRAFTGSALGDVALLVWAAVAAASWLAIRIGGGTFGLGLTLQRDAPLAAASSGIDAFGRRWLMFALGAGLAGLGGAFHAAIVRVVSPEALDFGLMVSCLAMTVIGGRASPAGAVFGALVLAWLADAFRGLQVWSPLLFGACLLAAILVAPDGVAGLAAKWRRRARLDRPASAFIPRPAPAGPDGIVLAARGLTKSFGGNYALRGIDIALRRGEILALIGPNGSGKTTALNILSGLDRADSGAVALCGRDVTAEAAWRRARLGLGRCHQTPQLAPDLTAADQVAAARATILGAAPWRRANAALDRRARAEAAALLDLVGARPEDAGIGARRRIELARALALEPAAILLDEPGAGLTEAEKQALGATIRRLAESGFAFLIVDHGMRFLLPLAARVVVLHDGRILSEGTPAAIAADPDVRRVYLGHGAAP